MRFWQSLHPWQRFNSSASLQGLCGDCGCCPQTRAEQLLEHAKVVGIPADEIVQVDRFWPESED